MDVRLPTHAFMLLLGVVGAWLPAGGTLFARDLDLTRSEVRLEPVRLDELGTDPVQALGPRSGRAQAIGGVFYVDAAIATPPLRLTIEREIPGLWRWRSNAGRPPAVAGFGSGAAVRLRSASGFDRMHSLDDASASLPVHLRALPPRVILQDDRGQTLEGGVTLQIDLSAATRAGRYVAVLDIDSAGDSP